MPTGAICQLKIMSPNCCRVMRVHSNNHMGVCSRLVMAYFESGIANLFILAGLPGMSPLPLPVSSHFGELPDVDNQDAELAMIEAELDRLDTLDETPEVACTLSWRANFILS